MRDPSSIFTGFFRMIGAEGEGRGELSTATGGNRVTAPEMCPSHWWSGVKYPSQFQQVSIVVGWLPKQLVLATAAVLATTAAAATANPTAATCKTAAAAAEKQEPKALAEGAAAIAATTHGRLAAAG